MKQSVKGLHSVSSISLPPQTTSNNMSSGMRPVNLRTDLADLANLIELVFSDTMDENGRAAIREMRYMSKMGFGLNILGRLNDLALGISLGYVWIEDERLVGNVSIYPVGWPYNKNETWIIANVGTHPDYQRRGIAWKLMEASLDMIRHRGGKQAILQVNYDNHGAIHLYERLGFARERAFTTWKRSSLIAVPKSLNHDLFITRRRPAEWQAEYELAQLTRPNERGGVGWMKPVRDALFHRPVWQQFMDWFSFNHFERLIIRDETSKQHHKRILAALWVENNLGSSRQRLTLMVHPDYIQSHTEPLLNNALRRFGKMPMSLEHPLDDAYTTDLLASYHFQPERSLWHMRLNL